MTIGRSEEQLLASLEQWTRTARGSPGSLPAPGQVVLLGCLVKALQATARDLAAERRGIMHMLADGGMTDAELAALLNVGELRVRQMLEQDAR